jgi:hypothetical protein
MIRGDTHRPNRGQGLAQQARRALAGACRALAQPGGDDDRSAGCGLDGDDLEVQTTLLGVAERGTPLARAVDLLDLGVDVHEHHLVRLGDQAGVRRENCR